jgi:hypothetical protein
MFVLLVGLLCILDAAHSARILGVFPAPVPSHYILSNTLMKGLAEKGHDVTMVSPFVDKIPPKNGSYTNIVLTGFAEEHERKFISFVIQLKKQKSSRYGERNKCLRNGKERHSCPSPDFFELYRNV